VDYGIESYSELVEAYQEGELEQVGGLGEGGQQHAAALTARDLHGLNFNTYVGYGGTGAAEEAVISDEVPFAYGTDAGFESAVEAGNAYPVAIASEERSEVFPDWPTVEEEGFEDMSFIGQLNRLYMAPPGLEDDRQQTLEDAFEEIHNSDQVQEWAESTGNTVDFEDGATAEEILADMFEEIPQYVDMDELAGEG
jgi:tripartite-type tricarboxylate transporter receptor subunit TctC